MKDEMISEGKHTLHFVSLMPSWPGFWRIQGPLCEGETEEQLSLHATLYDQET